MTTINDLQTEFNLSEEEIKQTLTACGISTDKKNYSKKDKDIFGEARKLFIENFEQSYERLKTHYQEQRLKDLEAKEQSLKQKEEEIKEREIALKDEADTIEYLRMLQEENIKAGVNFGIQQGDIMAEIIPQATIMRLKELIASGQLKRNFEKLWEEATGSSLGKYNKEYVNQEFQRQWNQYQLQRSQPPVNLLESSTQSSTNDSEL